ncbi:MAG TPA: hypothetical protein VK821_02905 [Dehalococcoidia bacterium]|nr:hypothetical protein [Dehalococcoidia bacterium]
MKQVQSKRSRPDIAAAERGGDWTLGMNGEGAPGHATLKQALHWKQIYTEILEMEEKVLARIRQLMDKQSDEARREVELTNVPVVVAQAERFRQRLSYWEARVHELNGAAPPKRGLRAAAPARAARRSNPGRRRGVTTTIVRLGSSVNEPTG